MEYGTLEYLEGYLCIKEQSVDSNEPIATVYYWPIMKSSQNWIKHILGDDFAGRPVERGGYGDWHESNSPYTSFRLLNDGQTRAIKVESVRVPAPRVKPGIELRWHWGHWEKYLKSRGWVSA